MPSSATITAFYTFAANNKARASQVNNNFDVFRGHIIPVHVSTITSANNTYDLGSTEYRWRNAYLNNIYLGTTTTSWSIADNTSTSEDLVFKKNGIEKFRVKAAQGFTTTAGIGQIASSYISFYQVNSSGSGVTGSTITINSIGNLVDYELVPDTVFMSATSNESMLIIDGQTTTNLSPSVTINLYRNSTLVGKTLLRPVVSSGNLQFRYPLSSIKFSDLPAAGSHTYYLEMTMSSLTFTTIQLGRIVCREKI